MFLKRGEEREVKFILSEEDFSLVDRNLKRIVEPGTFQIMIGAASDDIRLQTKVASKYGSTSRKLQELSSSVLPTVAPNIILNNFFMSVLYYF